MPRSDKWLNETHCSEYSETGELVQFGHPKYTSNLLMFRKTGSCYRKIRVILEIYSNVYGLYAVVSKERLLSKDFGYINLKRSIITIEECEMCVHIAQRGHDSATFTFQSLNLKEFQKLKDILLPNVLCVNVEHNEGSTSCVNCVVATQTNSALNTFLKHDLSPNLALGKKTIAMPVLDEDEEIDSL